MPFWRREPLHERLRREGGLGGEEAPTLDPRPRWGEVGIHGVHRQREWDGVVAATAAGLAGDAARFVVLPDGTLLVEDGGEGGELAALADAIEGVVEPPLRAHAVRRGRDVWAVAGRRLRVVAVDEDVQGDEVVLSLHEGERTLAVDGAPSIRPLPSLEALGAAAGASYTVVARRLDGELWEVEATAL